MHTGFCTSLTARLSFAIAMIALLLLPTASQAQGGTNTQGDTWYGIGALESETNGGNTNSAFGYQALSANTVGADNTAIGASALLTNTWGAGNTATGVQALKVNTKGNNNTASGGDALYANTLGDDNSAFGAAALFATTGSNNIALGFQAGQYLTTGSNNIDIGNFGVAGESGVIRIGTKGTHKATYMFGVDGVTSSGGVEVFINTNGQLGTVKSSRRFKKDIHDMGSVSDKLMQLRPVTFRYKQAADDGTHPLQYGLIAEEVAKVYPDLVQYDKAGKPFTIYYHLLTPMLLNELQKAHRENVAMKAAHKAEIAALKTALQAQGAELAALKLSQQQQLAALTKLTALVQTSRNNAQVQRAAYAQR